MALLEDLGGYLDTQLSGLTLGTNLFYGLLPETVSNCVALYENTGAPPIFTMGSNNLPQLERPQLQAIIRNTVYATGRSMAEDVYREITQISNITINGHVYLRVEALGVPSVFERDDSRRVLFTCNFDIIRITP